MAMHFYERTPLKGNVLTSNIEDARGGLFSLSHPPLRSGATRIAPRPPLFKMATVEMRLFSPSAACDSGAVASAHSERPRTQLTDLHTRGIIQGMGGKIITRPALDDSTEAGETLG